MTGQDQVQQVGQFAFRLQVQEVQGVQAQEIL